MRHSWSCRHTIYPGVMVATWSIRDYKLPWCSALQGSVWMLKPVHFLIWFCSVCLLLLSVVSSGSCSPANVCLFCKLDAASSCNTCIQNTLSSNQYVLWGSSSHIHREGWRCFMKSVIHREADRVVFYTLTCLVLLFALPILVFSFFFLFFHLFCKDVVLSHKRPNIKSSSSVCPLTLILVGFRWFNTYLNAMCFRYLLWYGSKFHPQHVSGFFFPF